MKKTLIITPPVTPNGDLHLGHLSGPYMRADIYRRYLRMRGQESYLLHGIDEHQSYVAVKARGLGLTAQQTADRFTKEILNTLQAAQVESDFMACPTRISLHQTMVEDFFFKLRAEGKVVAKKKLCLYCESCDQYLFEAYVTGCCPHCFSPSGGNSCEVCGRPNDCSDLRSPTCTLCGSAPQLRELERFYMPLASYQQQLRKYCETVTLCAHVRAMCEQMFDAGLPEIAITHWSNWGIPVPGYPGQTFYVWFEMAPGLLAATQAMGDANGHLGGWQTFWKGADWDVVMFCGFDNGYFYSLLFPAIFQAYSGEINLPKALLVNEFYHLGNSKFSTSRNHVIWGRELLADQHPDLVRFYLAYSGPEEEQTRFTIAEYLDTVKRELIEGWQGWLHRLGKTVREEYNGVAPAPHAWVDSSHQFHRLLDGFPSALARAYQAEQFSPRKATRLLMELVELARAFGQAQAPWEELESERQHHDTVIALELAAAKMLALFSAPIMPKFASRLSEALGVSDSTFGSVWRSEEGLDWVDPGSDISKLENLEFFLHENNQLVSREADIAAQR